MIAESLPVGDGVAQWEDWGTVVRIVVTEAEALAEAESLVRAEMAEVASACSRFRPSELDKVHAADGQTVEVSERLADLVSAAMQAARVSDDDVDPTMGKALAALGYNRDFAQAAKTVRVRERLGDPACTVSLRPGFALATSSTTSRQWRDAGRTWHHILDPRTCLPASPVWRTATVVAPSCLHANTITTAALVRGERAPAWIRQCAVPARLVAADGVHLYGGWPSEEDKND